MLTTIRAIFNTGLSCLTTLTHLKFMKENQFFNFPKRKIYKILLCMKIAIFLMVIFSINLSATGFGQISLNEHGKSVKEVIGVIENKTNYRFFYNDDLKSIDNLVDISVDNQGINQVLDKLFEDTEFDYKIMENNLIVIKLKSELQQQTVTGRITDAATGEPLPAVSIVIKGTTIGTNSDLNGFYSLNVSDRNAILVYSFVGYLDQEVVVGGRSNIDISLSVDVRTLEEVVVVGYGTQRKSDITGTVTSLPQERLQMAPNLNLTQAIMGSVPGVMIETSICSRR